MTYEESILHIYRAYRKGSKRGHEYMNEMLRLLGNPEQKLKIIHVAGTNGKGSTCLMLAGILQEAGYRVGLFTSPHLVKYNERFRINGEMIEDQRFADLVEKVSLTASDTPSFFEFLTLMAFVYFCDEVVDYAIIETGIGGLADATNVIKQPVLTVITSIGHDHSDILGDSLVKIAEEKAGIIKSGVPVVLHLTSTDVYNRINAKCAENRAELFYLHNSYDFKAEYSLDHTLCSIMTDGFTYENITLGLLGEYQIFNAVHVLLCVEVLRRHGVRVSRDAAVKGLRCAYWPGRMEIVSRSPLVMMDGAHNPEGAEQLVASLRPYSMGKRVLLLMGVLDKPDVRGAIDTLCGCGDKLWLTRPDSYKALPPSVIAGYLPDEIRRNAYIEDDCRRAFDSARAIAGPDDIILIAGSLYLIGDIKKYIDSKEIRDDNI